MKYTSNISNNNNNNARDIICGYCYHNKGIANVEPVHLMSAEQRQTEPTNFIRKSAYMLLLSSC